MSKLRKISPTDKELCKLNDDQLALVMGFLSGETYKELSFNFYVPIGTVKSRLSRATAKLLENRKNATANSVNQ